MTDDLRTMLRACGSDVWIHPSVVIERPDLIELGDRVRLEAGVQLLGTPQEFVLGSDVTLRSNCIVDGGTGSLRVDDRVLFFPGNFLALGDSDVGPAFVSIGSDTHFAPNGVQYGWGGLTIDTCVNVAAGVVFATVSHHHRDLSQPMAFSGQRCEPITIDHDVWIGANATLTGNVRMKTGSVLGANAVLTSDTEPFGIYGGVPARKMGDRRDTADSPASALSRAAEIPDPHPGRSDRASE
jgi:acetyltransferase-like isoleucine patch superfamily enzyme